MKFAKPALDPRQHSNESKRPVWILWHPFTQSRSKLVACRPEYSEDFGTRQVLMPLDCCFDNLGMIFDFRFLISDLLFS